MVGADEDGGENVSSNRDEVEGERRALDAAREARRQLRGAAARASEARKEVRPEPMRPRPAVSGTGFVLRFRVLFGDGTGSLTPCYGRR